MQFPTIIEILSLLVVLITLALIPMGALLLGEAGWHVRWHVRRWRKARQPQPEPKYVTFQGLDPWINTNYRDLMERANAAGLKVYNATTRPQAAEGDGDG